MLPVESIFRKFMLRGVLRVAGLPDRAIAVKRLVGTGAAVAARREAARLATLSTSQFYGGWMR